MDNLLESIKATYKRGGMFLKFIFVNSIVFLVVNKFLPAFIKLFNVEFDVSYWLSFDSSFSSLLYKPWTIISHMFIHADFSHLFYNMLLLFFVGSLLEQLLGSKKILSTYVLGGVVGGVIYVIAHNVFPLFIEQGKSTLLGASGAVMAIFAAAAGYAPNKEVHLFGLVKIKLYIIVFFFIALDLMEVSSSDRVAHFAHLGGAAWGYYFGYKLRHGKDISAWFDAFVEWIKKLFKKKSKMKVAYKKPPRNDYDYNAQKQDEQKQLDAILDKIKLGGYEVLTAAEKEFLAKF